MPKSSAAVVTIGIDPGKDTLHLVGLDAGAVCSTQGPDTEAQDQSLPLSRFSLQRTATSRRLNQREPCRVFPR